MPFFVQTVDEAVADALAWHLGPFKLDASRGLGGGVGVQVYVTEEDEHTTPPVLSYVSGEVRRARTASHPELLETVLDDVDRSVRGYLRDFLLVTGTAVVREDGAALVLLGEVESEGALRALTLLQTGWAYAGGGDVAVDPVTARIHPYARPLSLAAPAVEGWPGITAADVTGEAGGTAGGRRYLRAQDAGARLASAPADIATVVVVPRQAGAGGGAPVLSPLDVDAGVEALRDHGTNLHFYDELATVVFRRLADRAALYRLDGGSPTEQAFLLDGRFG